MKPKASKTLPSTIRLLKQVVLQQQIKIKQLQKQLQQLKQQKVIVEEEQRTTKLKFTASDDTLLEMLFNKEDPLNESFQKEFAAWKTVLTNNYNSYKLKDKNHDLYWKKKHLAISFMFCWCLRIQNVQNKPLQLVRFSFLLWHYGCHQMIWRFLSHLKLCYSYEKTRQWIQQCATVNLPIHYKWKRKSGLLTIGADNCAYYNKMKYRRTDDSPHFIQTINWWERYLEKPYQYEFRPGDSLWIGTFEDNREYFK